MSSSDSSSPEASKPAWRWTKERRSGVFRSWAERAASAEEEASTEEEEELLLLLLPLPPSAARASASVPAASALDTTAFLALTISPVPASFTPTTRPFPSSENTRDSTFVEVETTPPRRSIEAARAFATAEAPPSGNWSREPPGA